MDMHTTIFVFAFTYGTAFGMILMTLAIAIDKAINKRREMRLHREVIR